MNSEKWQKVKSVLEQVMDVPSDLRRERLERICDGDEELRVEVEALLEFDSAEADVLENSAFVSVFSENENLTAGNQIGKYRILKELGAGGMGTVFLAERADGAFEQQVALKLIKRGMDSTAVLRRFVNERQILASLKHPNIAHLIDGGTTENGSPFFVMEYVGGEPITDYARRENLDIATRLKLFREVCAAVAFAHRNLVIHRDLKPSNILVTADGVPKLLDFGIAKLLKNETEDETATRSFIFTPEYASPEQVRGEKLTTATDVYSLGVILYELLTETRPYPTKAENISEIIRLICETEPARPSSALNSKLKTQNLEFEKENSKFVLQNPKSLKGDLDNIILKALRKEPERRYSSVEQFSEDIQRHLDGLPVTASADTWNYRAQKFIARNRASVTFAALIVLALVGGIGATAWQARRAEQQRALAERRFENLRKMSNSISRELYGAIRDLPGSLPARQLLITRAVEQLDALAAEASDNLALQAELASAYENVGSLPDKPIAERQEIFKKAAAINQKILDREQSNTAARIGLALCYFNLADLSRTQGDLPAALDYNRRSISLVESVMRDEPGEVKHQAQFWGANYNLALTLYQTGAAAEAVEAARKILPVAESLRATNPTGTDRYNNMRPHLTRSVIAQSLAYTGDYQASIEEFQRVIADCEAEIARQPNDQILLRNLTIAHARTAATLDNAGAPAEAVLRHLETSRRMLEKLIAENPKDPEYPTYLAQTEIAAGQFLRRQNNPEQAVVSFRRAVELNEAVLAIDAQRGQNRADAAHARSNLGDALVASGRRAEGLPHLRAAAEFYESANAGATIDARNKHRSAEAFTRLAAALAAIQTPEATTEAVRLYRQSLELWLDLERRGALKKSDAAQPAEISRRLAELQ